jgi:hypothetical protein
MQTTVRWFFYMVRPTDLSRITGLTKLSGTILNAQSAARRVGLSASMAAFRLLELFQLVFSDH